jgi:hypothetical protein
MLSSIPTFKTQVARQVEIPGRWVRQLFAIPTIIRLYNWFMGGTDAMDQKLSYYRPHLKAVSWVPRMMCHMLNISVVNAYILYKEYYLKGNGYHLIDFVDALIEQLAEEYIQSSKVTPDNPRSQLRPLKIFRARKTWEKCFLERTSLPPHDCVITKASTPYIRPEYKITNHRGKCMICNRDVQTRCKQCDVYLCIFEDALNSSNTCFNLFHNVKKFPPLGTGGAKKTKKQATSDAII